MENTDKEDCKKPKRRNVVLFYILYSVSVVACFVISFIISEWIHVEKDTERTILAGGVIVGLGTKNLIKHLLNLKTDENKETDH